MSTTDPNSVETVLLQLKFDKPTGSKAPKQFYFQEETRAGGRKTVFDTNTLVSHLGPVFQSPISANPGLTLNKPMELTQDYH